MESTSVGTSEVFFKQYQGRQIVNRSRRRHPGLASPSPRLIRRQELPLQGDVHAKRSELVGQGMAAFAGRRRLTIGEGRETEHNPVGAVRPSGRLNAAGSVLDPAIRDHRQRRHHAGFVVSDRQPHPASAGIYSEVPHVVIVRGRADPQTGYNCRSAGTERRRRFPGAR